MVQLYFEGLCLGNFLESEAISIVDIIRNNFGYHHCQLILGMKSVCLPSVANLLRDVCAKNKSETNSVVELYFKLNGM